MESALPARNLPCQCALLVLLFLSSDVNVLLMTLSLCTTSAIVSEL